MKRIRFKEYNQDQTVLFPTRLDEYIPEESPVRLAMEILARRKEIKQRTLMKRKLDFEMQKTTLI